MKSVDGCITLRHKIMKRNCENETFTCRLKDPVLKDFGYGLNRVTVQKLKEGKNYIFHLLNSAAPCSFCYSCRNNSRFNQF